jgi:4-aminobutyrate aminotransferase-like enzyme
MNDLRQHLVPAIPRVTDLVGARGEGPYLFDASGRQYLDFTSGFEVNNTTCGTRDHVIRWIPPLVVGDEHVDDALEIFEAAMARVGDALRA